MCEGPILHLYKYGRKTELHTDACKQGYGAILLQEAEDGKLHPVYYMSKKTNTAEEKYDSYELEVLAIINALKNFRVYLLEQRFKIVTDCSAFQKTMQKKELITRIARWALQLEEFDYEIEHRAGSRMKHVDALSRYPVMMVCNDTLTSKLKNAQEEDDNIQTLKSLLEKQESEEFFERNANKKTGKKEEFLNPISKESIPLSTYHVDFIGPLPSTNKSYQHIFTVVDAFTKFTWLYPVKTVSAESALEKLKQQQKTFGNPIRIISDRGSAFTSKLFNDYCDEENIQHLQIATGVPRGNGQVERIHRTLIPVLTKLSLDDSTKWYKYVDRLQRIINSTISRSTKWTPFELLVGIKMRNKEDILIKDLLLEEMAKELLEQREFLRNDAKKNIETLQSENRKTYNRRRKKASLYKEGDLVAIQRTQFGAGLKLRPKFLGPYKVTKVNSKDRRLNHAGLYARRPAVCIPLTSAYKRARFNWSLKHQHWSVGEWANVMFSDESRFSLSSDYRWATIWRERGTRFEPRNITERLHFPSRRVMVWAGIMMDGRTDLHFFDMGSVTAQRYRNEVLEPYVYLFRGAVGSDFIFMEDNEPCHRAVLIDDFLETENIQRMSWPANSSDLNPIKHVWNMLGRQIADLSHPPSSITELKRTLQEVWNRLSPQLFHHLIASKVNRCAAALAIRGDHTPY
ncbi:transposable element Tcb2 transposase [Trichonephila clavipes]|nr:transposable element Tcb2 transposase [Trichonephila clavipes]